uniref:CMP/dCMP-type deaminase domain-containing protein n=1 Tax=Chelonoidis abingdonii TaxID=106734 RepID=A0A8C0H358_CHEAB
MTRASHRVENESSYPDPHKIYENVGARKGSDPYSPRHQGKISQKTFIDTYDPSVLRRVQYMLYEIKWSNNKRPQQSCCHRTGTKHAEIYFLEDVFRKERSDPSAHCFITWFMSWSPCGYCCKEIRGFLKDQPNVNLVIYVARIYWHKREINLLGLRSLMNIGVSIRRWDMEHFSSRSLVPIQPWSVAMDGSMEVIENQGPFYC